MLFISALAIFLLAERLEVVTARPAAASSSIINTPNEAAARPEDHLQLRRAGKTPEPASAPSHWTGVEAVETEELMCDLKERIETMRELQRGVLQSLAAAFSAARVRDDAASRAHVAEGRRLSLLIESSRETLVQVHIPFCLTSYTRNCSW